VGLIEAVVVKKEHRNKGIGIKLIKWALEKAIDQRADLAQLTSNKNRQIVLEFYEKLGFKRSHYEFKLKLN
jgi:GNAT superfamily N-acetyltransferase